MNTKQREIISDFLKGTLEAGESGDYVNTYNNSLRLVSELSKTDKILELMTNEVNEEFEL